MTFLALYGFAFVFCALVLLGALIVSAFNRRRVAQMYCPNCGSVAAPKQPMRGYFVLELLLWLFFLIPGMLYSAWRLTAPRPNVCPTCGSIAIPLNSPRAQQELA